MIKIEKEINKLTNKYKNFLLGFSGGIDSSVLLYLLNKFRNKKKLKIRAIHINHNINKLSKKWENHCIKICQNNNIKIIKKNIKKKEKKNIESKYREKRFKIFFKELKKKEILLTAHHKNDQCETILLALKRGSGITGLIGIKKKYNINKKTIIRPLINIEKKEIIKYAYLKKIKWINDTSNNNINFDRNFLRINIIPLILKRWPSFISCVYRTSKICFQQEKLLNKLIKKKYKNINFKKNFININILNNLKKEEFYFLIRKWLKNNKKKMISYKLIKLLRKNFIKNKKKIYYQIFFKEFILNKYKNNIYITKKYINNINILKWKKNKKKILLPNKLGKLYINKKKINKFLIRKPNINENIYIKFNIKGYISLYKKKKKIKNIWQELKIFPWERKNIPIIFYNNIPITAPGLFITKDGNPNKLPSWCITWKKTK